MRQLLHYCWFDSPKSSWTAPGGRAPSTCHPASWWTNLQQHALSLNLQRQTQTCEKRRCWRNQVLHKISHRKSGFVYQFMRCVKPAAPRGPIDCCFGRRKESERAEVQEWRPDFLGGTIKTDEPWQRGAKLLAMCLHFHLGKIMFVSQSVTNQWRESAPTLLGEAFSSPLRPERIPASWQHTCAAAPALWLQVYLMPGYNWDY